MIVGNGDIAQAIIDRPDRLYFASGVSNSAEIRASEYAREAALLAAQPPDAHLVYFSSLSIFETNGRYQTHKRMMEARIRHTFPLYAIIRIGNIDWGDNPHTLINYLRERHASGMFLRIDDVYRYVIDRPTFQAVLASIPTGQPFEFNAYGRRLTVAQVVSEYVYRDRVRA